MRIRAVPGFLFVIAVVGILWLSYFPPLLLPHLEGQRPVNPESLAVKFCPPDFIGTDCSVNILEAREYLPQELQQPSGISWAGEDVDLLQRILTRLQFKNVSECSKTNKFLPSGTITAGVGSMLDELVAFHIRALWKNQAVISSRIKFIYAQGERCDHELLECFLEPFSSCTIDLTASPRKDPSVAFRNLIKVKHRHDLIADPFLMPRRFANHGYFWFRVQVLRFAFRLQPQVLADVQGRSTRLLHQLGPKFLGVHIRHGDQCQPAALRRKNTTCYDLNDYMRLVERVSSKYNIQVIYLATDDEYVASRAAFLYPSYIWILQDHNRQIYTVPDNFTDPDLIEVNLFKKYDGYEAAIAVFTDLEVLSHSAALVGGFSSTISRMALYFNVITHKEVPPFISIDKSACWTFGNQYKRCGQPYVTYNLTWSF